MGVASQLPRRRFPRHNHKTQCSPVWRRHATEGQPSWFEMKSLSADRFYCYKKKKNRKEKKEQKNVIYLGTSARCHIYPRKRQRSRQVTPDTSESCTGRGHRLLFQLKTEAIGLQHKKSSQTLRLCFFFFEEIKVILRESLSVFHCLSLKRAITFEKAPSVF